MKTSKNQKASANGIKPSLSRIANKQSAATRANSTNRLVAGTLAVLGVASLATGGILMGHADVKAGNTAVATPSAEAAAPHQGSDSAAEVPYTPSKYPGVMVRNVPQPAPAQGAGRAGMNKGWIYVKPGAPKPRFGTRYGTRGAGIWYEPGKTKAGGTA
ncbi:MAG: hypothetical protein JOZ57_04155, partial [Abitibacteriaceae bacterium]|nr:hypothetical protein [Abditibacteriaceae bacterium]